MTSLVVDLASKCAWLEGLPDNAQWIVSGVTRRTAETMAHAAGWRRSGDWVLTSPPDGFWCPVLPCDRWVAQS